MKILSVGWPDPLNRELIEEILGKAFDSVELERIETEYLLRNRLSTLNTEPVDLVFMAVRFKWTTPERVMPEPTPDVEREGNFRAGFRCEKLLRKVAPHQPIILHGVGSPEEYSSEIAELPATASYIEDTYERDMHLMIRRAWRMVRSQ